MKKTLNILLVILTSGLLQAQSGLTVNLNDNTSTSFQLADIEKILVTPNEIEVEAFQIDNAFDTVDVGDTLHVRYQLTPENATNNTVEWLSSDEQIARINQSGVITGIAKGQAVITGQTSNPEIQQSFTITVLDPSSIQNLAQNYDDVKIEIFPNPTSNRIFINVADANRYEVVLTDLKGSILTSGYDIKYLNLSDLASGSYSLTVIVNGKYHNSQLIKQ